MICPRIFSWDSFDILHFTEKKSLLYFSQVSYFPDQSILLCLIVLLCKINLFIFFCLYSVTRSGGSYKGFITATSKRLNAKTETEIISLLGLIKDIVGERKLEYSQKSRNNNSQKAAHLKVLNDWIEICNELSQKVNKEDCRRPLTGHR